MPLSRQHVDPAQGYRRDFVSTHWSVVLLAGEKPSPNSAAAMDKLCFGYWYPLYYYVRRQGYSPEDTQDLTQSFFCHLIEHQALATVHPDKGRFRSFLLASLKHFLANEWDRSRAGKRGGGQTTFSLDQFEPEERYRCEPVDAASPDKLFDRRWAEEVLARAVERLRGEYAAAGWGPRFDVLKVYLLNEYTSGSYADNAAALGLSVSAVKSAIYKLRQRFASSLREDVAQTVATPADVEPELRELLKALQE